MMKTAIVDYFGYDLSPRERMRAIRRGGFDGVILLWTDQFDPDYLDLVFAQLASPQLKFCYDSGHENYFSPQRDLLAQYGHLLAALHLHDNPGTSDLHALPMTGTVDWPRVAQRLHQSGYPGALALEAQNAGFTHLTDPVAFLQEAHARLERLAGMMAE